MSEDVAALGHMGAFTLTRREVAARLGVSVSSVRRMEFDRLHPQEDEHGVLRFDPAELDGIPVREPVLPKGPPSVKARDRARDGKLAARVFRMFVRRVDATPGRSARWSSPQA